MSLLEANDFIIQKKILSAHEHYDFLDLQGNKLGEADGNLIQVPPKFAITDSHRVPLMQLQGKTLSLHREFTLYTPRRRGAGNNKEEGSERLGIKSIGWKKTDRNSCVSTATLLAMNTK